VGVPPSSQTSDGLTTNIAVTATGAGQDNGKIASRRIDQLRVSVVCSFVHYTHESYSTIYNDAYLLVKNLIEQWCHISLYIRAVVVYL